MTADELREIGERLYGPRWQLKLARALPVSTRTIRHWLKGTRKIRPPMEALIKSLSREAP